jgi:hypothetical protein
VEVQSINTVRYSVDADEAGVKQEPNVGFSEHLLENELESLGIEGPPVRVWPIRRQTSQRIETVKHVSPEVIHQPCLAAERVNAAGRGLSTNKGLFLDQHGVCSRHTGGKRSHHTGHAASGNGHIAHVTFSNRK